MCARERQPNTLFLLAGPSGVGKTTIVDWMERKGFALPFLQKAVTRDRRPGEIAGREIIPFDGDSFHRAVAEGVIVAPYEKYGDWYGLLSRSGPLLPGVHADSPPLQGIDTLLRSPAMTVGDPYEAPKAIRRILPSTVVIVLHASVQTVVQRIFAKTLSQREREHRLRTVDREYRNGFPSDVPIWDHMLSTDRAIDEVGGDLLALIGRYVDAYQGGGAGGVWLLSQ